MAAKAYLSPSSFTRLSAMTNAAARMWPSSDTSGIVSTYSVLVIDSGAAICTIPSAYRFVLLRSISAVAGNLNNTSGTRRRMSTCSLAALPSTLASNTAENASNSMGVFSVKFDGDSFASEGRAFHVDLTITNTVKSSAGRGAIPG